MNQSFTDYCPTKDKVVTIDVNYIDASNLENPNHYIKGRYSCDCAESCNQCKLYNNAPQQITL